MFRTAAVSILVLLASHGARPVMAQSAGDGPDALKRLVAEALQTNPEIQAARSEMEAARLRVAPAGALEDPMLEAGLLNVPTNSWRLNREDMTMKMLGGGGSVYWTPRLS